MEKRPVYFIILRAAQAFLGLIVLALAANFIHGAVTEEQVLALVCGLLSIFAAAFGIASGRIPSLQTKVILLVGMGADALLAVLWLASMGSNARLHSLLTLPVQCQGYYNNGDTVNSNYCLTKRTNPFLVVGPFGRATISIVAGLSALECILFIITLILTFLFIRRQPTTNANSYNEATKEADVPMQTQHLGPPAQQGYQTQAYQAPSQQQFGANQVQQQYQAPTEQQKVSPMQGYAAPASMTPPPRRAGYTPPHQPYQSPYQGQ